MNSTHFLGRHSKARSLSSVLLRFPFVSFIPMVIFLWVFLPGSSHGGKIYKWVDKQGVIHFSDRMPENLGEVEGPIEQRELAGPGRDTVPPKGTGRNISRSPIEHAANSTFTIKGRARLGSGFFVSPKGYAATCKHVIEETSNPVIILSDQTEADMKVIMTSTEHDLAVILVIVPGEVPYLTFRAPETLVPGERLYAIGSSVGLQATVTDGVFTGLREIVTSHEVIQFSAPINPGNSGGPLIDEKGRVVGVVSSKYVTKQGMPVAGVGFAIPSSFLEEEFSEYIMKEQE
ncbi:MAG: trypsin-like peptidase domain-containing protein [Deltaproteobacteria bacterium]|nr:trypsin-like peptidase domain-containing protein [Deltaproteobacteria bacterium]